MSAVVTVASLGFAWFATPGGMKQEKAMGKCETFFIREDFFKFAVEFEALISLGKFNHIFHTISVLNKYNSIYLRIEKSIQPIRLNAPH